MQYKEIFPVQYFISAR